MSALRQIDSAASPTDFKGSDFNILQRVAPGDIQAEPYPHVVITEALPAPIFAALAAAYPKFNTVARDEANENNKACLLAAAQVMGNNDVAPIWQAFFDYHLSQAFFDYFVDLWGGWVQRTHPDLQRNFGKPLAELILGTRVPGKSRANENYRPDLALDCVFGVNTPVRKPTSVRGAHIDSAHKFFSSLLYFREEGDDSQGGEYELLRLRNRMYPRRLAKKIPQRYVQHVKSVPYRSNTLIFWLNSSLSLHGVSPRAVTNYPRRYVAVMGESYSGKKQGFFAQHPQWDSPTDQLRSWINF